jgi:hypothetical protein
LDLPNYYTSLAHTNSALPLLLLLLGSKEEEEEEEEERKLSNRWEQWQEL